MYNDKNNNIMKIKNVMSAVLFVSSIIMVSCSQDEELAVQPKNNDKNQLQITVTDAGVRSDSQTRAVEDGYTTTFEKGDAIGVYAVNMSTKELKVENRKFVLGDDGWELALGSPIEYVESEMGNMKFYAYYPYQSNGIEFSIPKELNEDPFAKAVTSWSINYNDLAENYTKYDLMTSVATDIIPNGALGNVEFQLNHRMSMVLIALPAKIYTFENKDIQIESYALPATPNKFELKQGTTEAKVTPYYDKTNDLYRILVKANEEYTISGEYILDKRMTYTKTLPIEKSKAGMAVKLKLKGAINISHTLQVGDYYCADGSIVSTEESENAPTNAIGVVIYAGNPQPSATDGYGQSLDIMYNDYPACKHGLVMALNNAKVGSTEKAQFGNSSKVLFGSWVANNDEWGGKLIGNGTNTGIIAGYMGYNNTKIMEIATANEMPEAEACVNGWKYTKEYINKVAVPNVASTWFLPSTSEFDEMQKSLVEIINPKLKAVTGGQEIVDNVHYWTTTERSSNAAYEYAYNGGKCEIIQRNRGAYPGYFRMMLAF